MRGIGCVVFAALAWAVVVRGAAGTDDALVPEPARPSDSLVETIGLATHWGYHNTIYHSKWQELHKLLGDLGVRYVRDGLDPRMDELWKMYGVRAILVTGPGRPWEKYLESWKDKRHLIAAIEGPNEVNGWARSGMTYKGKSWPEGPRLFQDDLFRCVKGDPALKDIPVLALSTAYKGAGPAMAPLHSFDCANAHCYAGGEMPSRSLDFRDPYLLLGRGAVYPPLAATESGYHTCLGDAEVIAGSQYGVSHAAHRKYIPRQVAEYFNAGFVWTVIYEFAAGRPKKEEQADPEAAFGLLLPDGTPKPAYFALKSLIEMLSEARWDGAAGQWIRPTPFPPRALAFALRGAPETLHHTVLQRSDGSFRLLLWNEVSCFDLKSRKDICNGDVAVKLVLDRKAGWMTVSRLGPDAPPAERFESVKELDLRVPDEVAVVGIKIAGPLRPAAIDPPAAVEAKAEPTSVELSWPFSPGADAYWVTLHKRNLGRADKGADGKARFRMTGLIPATTYPYEIVAASLDGGVSAPAKVSATTVDAFPDLVVRSLRIIPESPKEGDTIIFAAVVENCGNAPTEDGVIVGTKFIVDGKTVCWCDNVRGPLAPGRSIEARPNSGPTGETSWILTRGCHRVTAVVDDVNRIVESNKANNQMAITVSTGTGPDLAVQNLKVKQAQQGKPLLIDVTLANQGSEPIEKGTRVSASIYATDSQPPRLLGYFISRDGMPVGGEITLTVSCQPGLEPGRHRLRAVADDVHRIPQLNKVSHQADFEVDIAASEKKGNGP